MKRLIGFLSLSLVVSLSFLLPGCGQISTGGSTGGWSEWSDFGENYVYSPAAYSEDGSKTYFSRGIAVYKSRFYPNSISFEGYIYEYELKYRKSSLYEIDLATEKVREIDGIALPENGTGVITTSLDDIYPKNYTKVAIRGSSIYYLAEEKLLSGEELYKYDLNDGNENLIISNCSNFDIDPNGEEIVYSTQKVEPSNKEEEIYKINTSNGEITKIISKESFSENIEKDKYMTIEDLKWSDNKEEIIFEVRPSSSIIQIWSVNVNTGVLEKLDTSYEPHRENVSPDRSVFIYGNEKDGNLYKASYDPNNHPNSYSSLSEGENLTSGISKETWGINY